jgi:cytochrome c peroxidase
MRYDPTELGYHANVNTEQPFDRRPGDPLALGGAEIDDFVAFLETLTDGYAPPQ